MFSRRKIVRHFEQNLGFTHANEKSYEKVGVHISFKGCLGETRGPQSLWRCLFSNILSKRSRLYFRILTFSQHYLCLVCCCVGTAVELGENVAGGRLRRPEAVS